MPNIAICIGHSRTGDKSGALNTDNVTEYAFNRNLGKLTAHILREQGHTVTVIDDYVKKGYGAAMCWVADECTRIAAQVAVELHFNSAGPFAEGHEWLHWYNSMRGQKLASCFNHAFKQSFKNSKARGVKSIDADERGGGFLRRTRCPAAILEPFFGSNKAETNYYSQRITQLAHVYAQALNDYFK